MEPVKANEDVVAIIGHSVDTMNNLREKIDREGAGLLRIIAMVYGMPVEEAPNLKIFGADGVMWVFDLRTHAFVEGKLIPLPQDDKVVGDEQSVS